MNEIKLAPLGTFQDAVKKILSSSKKESDKQLAKFQSGNARKRKAKRRG